jgi:hypothetical protein
MVRRTRYAPQAYLRAGFISSWSDKQIPPGSEWFEEIKSALTNTKVAVLLVTPNFIASDFIHEHELGPFLKMAEEGGVRILWVPVRASAYKRTPLKDYQAVLDTDKPLANMNAPERDKAWVKICEEIEKVVSNIPGRQQERAIREKAYGPRRSEAQEQPMPKDSKARVFMSHNSKDKPFVRKVVEARTLFILDWISDPALRRRSNAALNKGEARNALARALFFHRHGEIRDRTFENQRYRGLHKARCDTTQ